MAIPYIKDIEFEYGVVQQMTPLIRRVIANNPGPFTYVGTGVYIVGHGEVAVKPDGAAPPLRGDDGVANEAQEAVAQGCGRTKGVFGGHAISVGGRGPACPAIGQMRHSLT